MSGILDLPIEPFSEIIKYLDAQECTALWISGDLKMQWRLGKGKAVRTMGVYWGVSSRCLWPPQIVELAGLETFSFSQVKDSLDRTLSSLELQTLSRNLKRLQFSFETSAVVFQAFQSAHPNHFSQLEQLSITFKSPKEHLEIEIPPTVTDLAIYDYRFQSSSSVSIPSLPAGLTQLFCQAKSLTVGDLTLPHTIKSIDMHLESPEHLLLGNTSTPCTSSPSIFPLLPSGIEKLTLKYSWSGVSLSSEDWLILSALPLKKLDLIVTGHFDVEEAQSLPRSLEDLKLERITISNHDEQWTIAMLKALPKNLKRLIGILPSVITLSVAQNLPKTLTAAGYLKFSPESISYLPDGMESIDMRTPGDLSLIKTFPSRLVDLRLNNLPLFLLDTLPNSLKSLVIFNSKFELTLEIAQKLPRNLTSLVTPKAENPLRNLERVFEVMPTSLSVLRAAPQAEKKALLSIPTPSDSSLLLPRNMRRVEIGCLDFTESNAIEWLHGLPTGLRILSLTINHLNRGMFTTLGQLKGLHWLCIITKHLPSDGWAKCLDFPSLPRQRLRVLKFYSMESESSDITNDTFSGAPPMLSSMTIPKSPLLTRECQVHIPAVIHLLMHPSETQPNWFVPKSTEEYF